VGRLTARELEKSKRKEKDRWAAQGKAITIK